MTVHVLVHNFSPCPVAFVFLFVIDFCATFVVK